MEGLPKEIFFNILNHTNNQTSVLINMATKNLYAKTAPALKELASIYHSLAGKSSYEIVDLCLNSMPTTKAVLMSNTLHNLTEDDIIKIACNSYDHASIVLKSHFIQNKLLSYIKNEEMLHAKNKCKIKKEKKQQAIMGHTIPSFDASSILDALTALESVSLEFTPVIDPIKVVEAITAKGLNYAILVLKHVGELLSGFRLMEIAKCSIEHAKFILGSTTLRNHLKPGHIIDIAKTSLKHTQCVLNTCLLLLKEAEIKQIISIDDTRRPILVWTHLAKLLTSLPLHIIKEKPQATKGVIASLFFQVFYNDKNPYWALYKAQQPEMANLILHAQSIILSILPDKNITNREIALKAMSLSIAQAKEILSIPNIEQMLGRDLLQKLASKNEEYSALITNFLKNGSNVAATEKHINLMPNSYKSL